MISIREEIPDDHIAIGRLTVDAFTHSKSGYHGEANLIERLRATCSDWLSLIACYDEAVAGHILFTPVAIRTSADEFHGWDGDQCLLRRHFNAGESVRRW